MKVLFGLSDKRIVKEIAKLYKEKYDEKLECKFARSYNKLKREASKNKYDRVVLSENFKKKDIKGNTEAEKQLFEYIDGVLNKLDKTDLIFIASEGRKKDDMYLERIFTIGAYTILVDEDRTMEKLCEAIKSPMTKEEARRHHIDA